MEWLATDGTAEQDYKILRLYAPEEELVMLDFNPLKLSAEPDWNPMWEEWHCYPTPLMIYKQDYKLLLKYFDVMFPSVDAVDGTPEDCFDVCSLFWIGRSDWDKMISAIEGDLDTYTAEEQAFFIDFINWIKEALNHTDVIVVEGNQ